MRLLHTSDWHLGQTLHGFDRSHEHQAFLDWLLDTLEREAVDALLVAGDVFDTANPSAAAQHQLYAFLGRAKARLPHLHTVLIAGNHDSAARLEAPGPLLAAFDARASGQLVRDAAGAIDVERLLLPLCARDGRIAAWVLAVPFLRPGDVPRVEGAADPYPAGVAALYAQALELALQRRAPGQAIVALGHCHMAGGEVSADSERRLVIGGAEALPAGLFDPRIAYVALGHLHRAQRVGGDDTRRYAGSPLPLAFTERDYRHQVLRVDLDGERVREVTALHVPRAVPLLRVPERHAPPDAVLAALAALALPPCPPAARPYLEVRVQLDAPEPGLRARIEAALEGRPVRLARIDARRSAAAPAAAHVPDDLARLQPVDVFERRFHERYGAAAPEPLRRAFAELLHAAAAGEAR